MHVVYVNNGRGNRVIRVAAATPWATDRDVSIVLMIGQLFTTRGGRRLQGMNTMNSLEGPNALPSWVVRAAAGDFSEVPDPLHWEDTNEFALLIDGYSAAGGMESAFAVHASVMDEIERTGTTQAQALDLWIALFIAWRSRHFTIEVALGSDGSCMTARDAGRSSTCDRLCHRLRERLGTMSFAEADRIANALRQSADRRRLEG